MTTHTTRHVFANHSRHMGSASVDMRDVLSYYSISQIEECYTQLEKLELSMKVASIYAEPVAAGTKPVKH